MNRTLLVGLLTALTLGATLAWQHATAPRIAQAQAQLQARTWLSVLPTSRYDNQPLQQPLALPQPALEHSHLLAAYRATLQGRTSAVVLHSQTQGYEGPIQLLIAIDRAGRVMATKVLEQHETPGLGDKIAEPDSPWLGAFTGLSQGNTPAQAWGLKRDNGQFDQLAGASVTSRAVIHAVQDALRYFDSQAPQWLAGEPDE